MAQLLTCTRAALRQLAAHTARHLASPLFLTSLRRPEQDVPGVSVHMLVSGSTWHAGLLAACSLEFHTRKRWNFTIHEDGSVPPAAMDAMRRQLPGVRIIARSEADRRMQSHLAAFPECLAHRARHNLFLKFADPAAYCEEPRLIILDSDVLFFRRPDEILEWALSGSQACLYNQDTKEKFCIPRAEIERLTPHRLPPLFNSGLVLIPHTALDLALAESFLLTFRAMAHAPQFFEQTLFGLMATRAAGGWRPLPQTYNISWDYLRAKGSVCRHYVGDFKHDLLYIEGASLLAFQRLRAMFSSRDW